MNTKPRILYCFLFWKGDQTQLEKTARVAFDLRKETTEEAEVMFVHRFDSPAPSAGVQYQASQKFTKVHVWKCDRRAEGFPGGCNEMAYGILNHILMQRHLHGNFKNIDALMILESDVVFLRPTWIEELQNEWLKAQQEGKRIVGAVQEEFVWQDKNGASYVVKKHVNAVALYEAEIVRSLPCLQGGPNQTGWDHYHGDSTVPVTYNSKLFKLDYRKPTITKEELESELNKNVLVYHGVKDDSLLNIVKKKYSL